MKDQKEDQPKISRSVYEISTPAQAPQPVQSQKSSQSSQQNLWNKILSDVAKRETQKDSTIVLLGDKSAGKRSLINAINQKHVHGRNKTMPVDQMGSDYAALDYSFLYVKDLSDRESANSVVNADDNLPILNIWRIQESEKMDLLEAAIQPANLKSMAIMIVLDFDTPWELMNQLKKWIKAIQAFIFKILPQLEPGVYERMKNSIVNQWKSYQEPELDEHGQVKNTRRLDTQKSMQQKKQDDSDDDQMQMEVDLKLEIPLSEGVLKVNLGIPILVVINKVDLLLHGDKKSFLEENFDFIQKHIREYSMQYGASVIYTSATANRNLNVLYQYLLHRLYDMDFKHRAEILERENLFIPAGFDTPKLISELIKGQMMVSPSGDPLLFEDIITQPQTNTQANRNFGRQQNQLIECQEWNQLLYQQTIKKVSQTSGNGEPTEKLSARVANPTGEPLKPPITPRGGVAGSGAAITPRGGVTTPRGTLQHGKTLSMSDLQNSKLPPLGTQGAQGGNQSGNEFFKKLLQTDQLKKQKARQSQLFQAEKAEELAARLKEGLENQQEITEETTNPNKEGKSDDSSSSSPSEDLDNAEQDKKQQVEGGEQQVSESNPETLQPTESAETLATS